MSTTGHETEAINVRGMKTTLQKMKTDLLQSVPYYVTNAAGTAGSTTSGAYNRTQWTGNAAGISTLYTGAMVLLKVPVKGVSRGVTLNINSLGEHPVLLNASTNISTAYPVGAIIPLVYDADQTASVYVDDVATEFTGCWKIANYDSNTTYKPLSLGFCIGQCDTAAATKAKTVTMEDYALVANGIVSIKFTEAITVASATLNINSKGAKAIYYKGAALAANVIQAGDIVTMQYSTQYHIIGILRASGIPEGDLASAVQTVIDNASSHVNSTSNPHGVTKEQVGLGNVENKSSATIRGELTSANVTSALGYTPPQQDTTYESKDAASGGTDVSLVTTGEKYTWNNKQDAITNPANIGFGIGTCSTAAATADKEVALSGYNLVQNGFVAVTFENDVPANATLNINNKGTKAVYHKGAAIEANVIMAGDTALFAYDGTNYILISSGATNLTETVTVSLTQVGGTAADLVGASITITDVNSQRTIMSALWNGVTVLAYIPVGTAYKVTVGSVTGYSTPSEKNYTAQLGNIRDISLQYVTIGVFIEDTDGQLYTSSQWPSSGKTANSVVVSASNHCMRIAISGEADNKKIHDEAHPSVHLTEYMTPIPDETEILSDYNGAENTDNIIAFNTAVGTNTTSYAAPYCHAFTFPAGQQGHLPACGELNLAYQNLTAINQCMTACDGAQLQVTNYYRTSTYKGLINVDQDEVWCIQLSNGYCASGNLTGTFFVRPFAEY